MHVHVNKNVLLIKTLKVYASQKNDSTVHCFIFLLFCILLDYVTKDSKIK